MNKSIIVALDFPTATQALDFARQLSPNQVRVKVGKELFVANGPAIVESLQKLGFDVFLDLKFHDIPNTVANACLSAAKMGVWMVNVHASGGTEMMQKSIEKLSNLSHRPLLTAVTVLTSMNQSMLNQTGIQSTIEDRVKHLALLTHQAGLDGIVCSAKEAAMLKQLLSQQADLKHDFCLVTPGIRLPSDSLDDQQRVAIPQQAIADGVDYLVMGRPITQSANPQQTIDTIYAQIATNIDA